MTDDNRFHRSADSVKVWRRGEFLVKYRGLDEISKGKGGGSSIDKVVSPSQRMVLPQIPFCCRDFIAVV